MITFSFSFYLPTDPQHLIASQFTPVRRSSVIVHTCQTGPTMSIPAMSTLAFSLVRHCPVLQFQSPHRNVSSAPIMRTLEVDEAELRHEVETEAEANTHEAKLRTLK